MLRWSAGAAIALYGWVNGTLASGVARLDDRLGLGATLVGAHLAAFAVGLIVTGASASMERLAPLAPVVFATTLVLFLAAPHPVVSLVACVVLGVSGSLTLARAQALLADPQVSADPARALMIANIVAAATAAIAATIVGLVAPRLTVFTPVPALVLAVIALDARHAAIASATGDAVAPNPTPNGVDQRRPRRTAVDVVGLTLVAVCVAIELTVANQLTGHLVGVEVSERVSDGAVGMLFVGLTLGRILVAAIGTDGTPHITTSAAITAFVALVGVTVAPNDPVVVAAVFVLGLALGPLFPLVIARVLAAANDPARTSALTTSAIGTAVLVAPPSAGAARDIVGDRAGLALLTALAAVAVALTLFATPDRP